MSLHDDASLATVLAQLDDSTNQTWKAKRSGWAKLVRAQAAELERMRAALTEAMHQAVDMDGLDVSKIGPQHWYSLAAAALAPQENPR